MALQVPGASRILNAIAKHLEVPPSLYDDATARYRTVGAWLSEGEHLARFKPDLFAQGSFALGTANRPSSEDDYDIDAACVLHDVAQELTPAILKELIGDRLKEHDTYRHMLDPPEGGRRCWTIRYADSARFHLDIVPAVPDDNQAALVQLVPQSIAQHALKITDRDLLMSGQWTRTNPRGYAAWFRSRMDVVLEKIRRDAGVRLQKSIADVPEFEVRTPLQRAVQLLKCHRDARYAGRDDRPASIIITTLAALAYQNDEDLGAALVDGALALRGQIKTEANGYAVRNPTDPRENFADRWRGDGRRQAAFFEWLASVEDFASKLSAATTLERLGYVLVEAFGRRIVGPALASFDDELKKSEGRSSTPMTEIVKRARPDQFDVPHRALPPWPQGIESGASLQGYYRRNDRDGWHEFTNGGPPLPRGLELSFAGKTNAPRPFDVFWQVVNTGEDARRADGLRGEFERAEIAGSGGLSFDKIEATEYAGRHSIQFFVVKDGVRVAQSPPFVVNIA